MADIKNILFDLGNVLLPISYDRCFHSFQQFTKEKIDWAWFSGVSPRIFEEQEVGNVPDKVFFDLLRAEGTFEATDQQLKEAWNSLLLEIPQERYELLHRLATRYRLYLLSNTNDLHKNSFEEHVIRQTGKPLQSFFIDTYYSHEIKLRKPNAECYHYVLNHSGLVAEETLFIDDNEQNATSAALLGIHTLHLQRFDSLLPMLEEILRY